MFNNDQLILLYFRYPEAVLEFVINIVILEQTDIFSAGPFRTTIGYIN